LYLEGTIRTFGAVLFLLGTIPWTPPVRAQAEKSATGANTIRALAPEKAMALAGQGRCKEAIPGLKKAVMTAGEKEFRKKAGLLGVRCALTIDDRGAAGEFLELLLRRFPRDPEVLYIAVHAYSDLSLRTSQELARTAPQSSEAHELNAEAYEIQGKWDEAEKEYHWILEHNPDAPGIHFRLGRLLLSEPNPGPNMAEDAKKEFEKEIEVDPGNAGAEYVLGQLAQQAQAWPEAIEHFTRATKNDAGFVDAYFWLGVSYASLGKYAEAIRPLESAVKLDPANPAGHYQLAIAYSRAGRKEQAAREMALHQETTEKANRILHPEEQENRQAPPHP
jgi:tetratricopeptide (TPR) repeat protein